MGAAARGEGAVEPVSRRVAFYGGSFDPPHMGHVLVALMALCRARVDEVRVVPVSDHAFGKQLTPFEHRVAMVSAAMAPLGPRVVVDRSEADHAGPSFTIDTLERWVAAEPGLEPVLVIGTDLVETLPRWHRANDLLELVDVFVVGREGAAASVVQGLPAPLGMAPAISSTMIREALASRRPGAAEALAHDVPEGVVAYAQAHELYR